MEREIAMKRAASFCAESERNVAEVERKLRKWGVDDDDIDSIIDRLKSDDFLNEERYCRAYINDRFRLNHWGKVKIRYELGKRDVDRQYIDAALADIYDDEYIEVLKEVVEAKRRTLKETDTYSASAKILRYALTRGFESDIVSKILKDVL
jgi:recX family